MTRTEQEYDYIQLKQRQVENNLQYLQSIDYKGSQVSEHFQIDPKEYPKQPQQHAKIFYFDIDNTLYSQRFHINEQMQQSITDYMVNILHFQDHDQAMTILQDYCNQYGLSLIGFMKDYNINPEQYNLLVDDSLQLNHLLKPDLKLRHLLLSLKLDYKFDKLWLFTNSYKNHALRCVKLLGIADLFDGITYCNYDNLITNGNFDNKHSFRCKPNLPIYEQLKLESGLTSWNDAFFVDDNLNNLKTAKRLGMKRCFNLIDRDETQCDPVGTSNDIITISSLLDIPKFI